MKYLIIFLFISVALNGQTTAPQIKYSYDNRGNRTDRIFTVSAFRLGNQDSTQSAKEFAKVQMKEGISVFPNPTKDKVVLTINDYDSSERNSMALLDSKGNEILSQRITKAHCFRGIAST